MEYKMTQIQKKHKKQRGFTLVELSIVILIIGLLVAGIAAGTNMIKQAELRSIISDYYSHTVGYNNFISNYGKVPGDMDIASAQFTLANCASTAALCNGNGNGIIDYDGATATTNEVNKAWKHLELAGVIGNSFQLVPSSVATLISLNAPQSKRAGIGFVFIGGTNAAPFSADKNVLWIGKAKSGATLLNGAVTASEASQIDRKIDDAYTDNSGSTPVFKGYDTGTVRSVAGEDAATGTCTTAANGYTIASTVVACRVGMAVN